MTQRAVIMTQHAVIMTPNGIAASVVSSYVTHRF